MPRNTWPIVAKAMDMLDAGAEAMFQEIKLLPLDRLDEAPRARVEGFSGALGTV